MNARLHHRTPTISAIDSRGLRVRQVAYWRSSADDSPQARITRQQYDTAGHQVAQWDARLFANTPVANLTTIYSLSGKTLLVDSVDSGWRLSLPGDTGQILHSWDQRGNNWQTTYDNQLRPTAIQQQSPEDLPRIIERFSYGDSSLESATGNCCGVLTRHDDSAGTLLINEYALCAKPLSQTRHFLLKAEQPSWPADEQERNGLHERGDGHKTNWKYNTQGEIIRQIDAGQHQQRFSFDVAGQLKSVNLKVKDAATEKTIAKNFVYNAFGQVESQTTGNGVIHRAVFDPASGRLTSLNASVSGNILQELHYTYDAVGNVTRIEDKAQPVRFGNNQRVEAISTFTYDSLYQLTSATGREAAGQNVQLHLPLSSRTPIDANQLFNFIEHYEYDSGGNLTELRHVRDGNNYTRTLNVATASNRLLSWNKGGSTPDVPAHFDTHGNPQALYPGQALEWNTRNQLGSVMLIQREDGRNDTERYDYDSSGQRVRKVQTTYAASVTHIREVRYLPGLEIRTRTNERLEVITLQSGRCSVRYLHWTKGRPTGIAANQLRYSLDDHLGSSSLELDDQAWLISQESYLPYGGTAWAASRSAVEADYKTIRYCGKERDASGFYYYGHRYYAPWLQRWISPDPAGAVDGLNLYCMVGNNPVKFVDHQGLMRGEYLEEFAEWGRGRSHEIMKAAQGRFTYRVTPDHVDNSSDTQLNETVLSREFLAHSYGYTEAHDVGLSDFFNLPKPPGGMTGYLGVDRTYKGIVIGHSPPDYYLRFGTYKIDNTHEYLADLSDRYRNAEGQMFHNITIDNNALKDEPTLNRLTSKVHELQQPIQVRIESHINEMHGIMPTLAGAPGAHAEVRLVNSIIALYPGRAERMLADTVVFTDTLSRGSTPQSFPACINCSSIIPEDVNIPTGRNPPNYTGYNTHVRQIIEPQRTRGEKRPWNRR